MELYTGHDGLQPRHGCEGGQASSRRVAGARGDAGLGQAKGGSKVSERQMTVWIYVDTNKQVGDREHLKVFASLEAALAWFELNDPEGVAFEYEVIGPE